METGILSDGSLSARLKGDIYWKKQKLMFRANSETGSKKKATDIIMADLFTKYDSLKELGESPVLFGDEFLEWPPTAVGRDISLNGIAKAMIRRDEPAGSGEDERLRKILEKAIEAYFTMDGYDEKKRSSVDIGDTEKHRAEEVYLDSIKAYSDMFESGAAAGQQLSDDQSEPDKDRPEYEISELSPSDISQYQEYIPDNYLSQIRDGSLKVMFYFTAGSFRTADDFVGLSITGVHNGWLEIVWMSLLESDEKVKEGIRLLSFLIRKAREKGRYKGVFLEMHREEVSAEILEALQTAGMSVQDEKNNNYEFVLSDIKQDTKLLEVAKKQSCTALDDLDIVTRQNIEAALFQTFEAIPVSLPVSWGYYEQSISFAYYRGQDKIGLLLISKRGDTLIIDLLYGTNPMIVAALLGSAMEKLREVFEPGQKFLVPIVVEASRHLVEKLVDKPRRGDITEAVIRF